MLSASADKSLANSLAMAKAYQAGALRAIMYPHINETISIPELYANVSVKDFTSAIAAYINGLASAAGNTTLVQPLVDESGIHLTNADSEGKHAVAKELLQEKENDSPDVTHILLKARPFECLC